MFSLFSSFDSSFFLFPSILDFIFLSLIFINFFCLSMIQKILNLLMTFLFSLFNSVKSNGFSSGSFFLFLFVFIFLFFMNFFSMFPFIPSHTVQISLIFFIGLSFWLCFNIFHLIFNFRMFFSHLIPEGCPFVLVPFLLLIELVSHLIRPITISVRLVANILAGHLLLILLSKVVHFTFASITLYFLLNILEFFVSLIQAYIFVIMVSLYYCDVN